MTEWTKLWREIDWKVQFLADLLNLWAKSEIPISIFCKLDNCQASQNPKEKTWRFHKNGLFHYFYYWLMTAVLFAKVASARSNASIRVSQIQPLQKCGFLGIYRRSGAKINKFWLVCRCYWSPAKKCARTLFIIVEERALMRSYCSSDPFDRIISGCLYFLMKDNCHYSLLSR